MTPHKEDKNEQNTPAVPRIPGAENYDTGFTISKAKILKGLRYFAIITVAALTAVFLYTSTPQTFEALKHLEGRYMLIAAVLAVLDYFICSWRNHIFVRKIKPGVSQWLCFRANLANLFIGAVTPSQSGGGPAQLFVLYKGGIPLAGGISVSIINFLSTLIFFLVAAAFSVVMVKDRFSENVIRYLMEYGFVAFFGLFLFFIFALWRPDLLGKLVDRISRLLEKTGTGLGKKIARLGHKAVSELDHYHATCTTFMRREPILLVYSFIITIIMYTNKFTLGYFIMRGLGVDGDYLSVLGIQFLLLFILYFSPSPGGNGIAELSTAALMSTLMPAHLLPLFTLLNRFFLLYLPAALGAIVMMHAIGAETAPFPSENPDKAIQPGLEPSNSP